MRLEEIDNKASVMIMGHAKPELIPITNPNKPLIVQEKINKWQDITNLLAACLGVPAALIMQVHQKHLSVFMASSNPENPFEKDNSNPLLNGLYCETVLGTNQQLIVPNATEDALWQNTPGVKLGMVSYLGFPIRWPDGEFFGTVCVMDIKTNNYSQEYIQLMEIIRDSIEKDLLITSINQKELEKTHSQLQNKIYELDKTKKNLQAVLINKETLLQEIHHRVKNNLQFISSLIEIQLDHFTTKRTHQELLTVHNRIQSMKIVHSMLYKNHDFTNIKLNDYTTTLSKNLLGSYHRREHKIEIATDIDYQLATDLNTAIYIGLILNEALTNALKHAFPKQKNGKINISIKKIKNNTLQIIIEDNGIGIPHSITTENTPGLGLKIIQNLVLQMKGKMSLEDNHKTRFIITIPESY